MDRTPEQTRAIEVTGKNLCVDAGAGSGKTSVLVGRVLHILEKKLAPLDQIVAITFTDKAAAEMKERLRREFHRRAPLEDAEAMSFWRDLERRADSARFTTIHSFCAGLLRENALAFGADPDFAVLADAESFLLREEVIDKTLHSLLNAGDEDTVRAAAGYGMRKLSELLRRLLKQRGLMERIGCDHPLHDPAALAAHWQGLIQLEMKRRRRTLPQSRALRNFRKRLVSYEGQCANAREGREALRRDMLASLDRILAGGDLSIIEKELAYLASAKARGAKKDWPSEEVYDAVKDAQDELTKFAGKNLAPSVDDAVERAAAELTCSLHRVYLAVAAAFQEAKAGRPAQDFDDLILAAWEMLRNDAHVRARTARGIKYLLVDEFQDTDERQLEIARALCDEPNGPELFIVGDAKQSIYRFRGAEVGVFARARKDADEIIPLARNFRSVPNIVEFVNDFFDQSGLLDAVEPEYRPLQAHRDALEECRVEFLIPEIDEASSADARRIEEARFIAGRLAQMCAGADGVEVGDSRGGDARPAHFGDVAVLFRSLSSVYLYEQVFRERGIPYTVVAGAGFYERQEVLDIRNALSLVADPWNEMALLGFLRSPMVGLPDDALVHVCERASLSAAFREDSVPDGFSHEEAWKRARTLFANLRSNRERPLPDFVRYLLDQTGYEAVALSQFLGTQKALNIRKVLDLAEDFARTRAGNLAAFVHYLDEIAAESEIREGEASYQSEETGAVTLMTIHKSKGLEFPIVVIPDLGRGTPPRSSLAHAELGMAAGVTGPDGEIVYPALYGLIHSGDLEEDIAEGGRVLYVAMTRARDWLLMSGARDPQRTSGSWLEAFEEVYDVSARADGAELSGDGWRLVVRRTIDAAMLGAPDQRQLEVPTRETLQRQVAPAPQGPMRRVTFAVSTALDALAGETDPDDESHEDDEQPRGGGEALLRGTLVHRMFERWDFSTGTLPDIDALLRREHTAPSLRAGLERALNEAAKRFMRTELWMRIAAETEAERELPFLLRLDGSLINGTIDLALADGTIVDYKTGRRRPELHFRYERQLQIYALARKQLTGLPVPAALLYYVDEGRVDEVDVSVDALADAVEDAKAAIRRLCAGTG
ncbi:MAG: UvrD-helicase domain-containing protein [Candidatus Hydrogenedentes bacterium]|nr:UvrD-helicase domain-containing protein [Candidatus Hydrogenedentota bacterium]